MIKLNKRKSTKKDSNLISNIQPLISDHNGITLVALIITIIVMLILVGVSISIAINGGLFDITKRAVKETENAKNIEQQLANGRIKVGDTWYDSIEDYVNDKPSGNQGEGGEITAPKPQIGDYVKYEPDIVSASYSLEGDSGLEGKYSGHGDYDTSKLPFTLITPKDQKNISQEKLDWQILKIHDDGSIDLIGTPTDGKVNFGGAVGYNNGVYLLNDICKDLYSKKSAGIEARSVRLEDFEDENNEGNWKSVRDAYTESDVQYGKTKTYTDNKFTYYPNLYARESGSGISGGISGSDKGYNSPTEDMYSQADTSGLTATQTYYSILISEENYGKSSKVLSQSNSYWVASRTVACDTGFARFGLRTAGSELVYNNIFVSNGGIGNGSFSIRPIVSLKSSAQLKLVTEGASGSPNTFEITKY